ncbi:glycoside hydrolase family 2 protein [Actinoplanes sp. Pm04-4]|uniref:beta-mannosidase n=1 Tax=Paractinoplanes pyxinae TaxID=2997416 RepID=A0ABT4B9W0_9ACTN|nr:glycoside hydrolase family 2 protein [Actinoplanes pyxinae]MCY1143251.1 glycoside hydrolase family 2 protein [Actinoplanes pyxinae]
MHTDLLAAGKIVDPFLGENEKAVDWVGRANWVYERDIAWDGPRPDRIDLVFDGLDTVADIELDGVVLGSTRNMHRSYRFDITDQLGDGPLPLRVRFTSTYTEAERLQAQLGPRPNAYPEPFNFVRKMACSFGWDWGPTLVTAGIWRNVRLEGWNTARLRSVKPLSTYADGRGHLDLTLDIERTDIERAGVERFDAQRAGVERMDAQRAGAERMDAERAGVERFDAERAGVERFDAERAGVERFDAERAGVERMDAERAGLGDGGLRVLVSLDGRVVFDGAFAETVTLEDERVEPWNPRGYGDANLYDLCVVLLEGDVELDRWERRVGFRTVDIDRDGGAFVFQVNEQPVFVKGVNWIPDDIFPSRMTRERYALRLGQAAAAGVNLVRIWGGGIYESRDFYEVCDELGLMVWQDFLFACACYPEEEPLHSEVVAEARENVVRLAPHPSLVAWNGNNENLWLYGADDWASRPGGDLSWGETYYLKTLPDIVSELDPSRPYMAGSPWSGSWEHEPNSTEHGTFHSWDVWNREDYLNYRESAPRFVAEFGWQAPPAWRTLREAVTDEPMRPDSPGVLHHQKAIDGNGKLARGLAHHFPEPGSTEAWHFLTQLNQVRAVRTGIAHWRSHWPHTGGTILWQLNDLWPVISWAAIDGAGRYKPLYFEMRSLYAERSVTIQPRDGGLVVAVMNDRAHKWTTSVRVERMSSRGVRLCTFETAVDVAPRANVLVPIPSDLTADDGDPSDFLVVRAAAPAVEGTLAEGALAGGASAGGVLAGGASAEGALAGGAPAGGVLAEGALIGGLLAEGAPAGGTPAEQTPAGDAQGRARLLERAENEHVRATPAGDVRANDVRDLWFFQDFHLDDPGLTVTVDVVPDGLDVTVRAAGLARDVLLQPDRIHPAATVDQGFVTLLPGETTTFRVRGTAGLDAALVKAPWVLTDLATVLR